MDEYQTRYKKQNFYIEFYVKVILGIRNFNQLIVRRGELKKMANFFLILIGLFIIISNIVGFISYQKKKSLYAAAFTILILAALFGAIGGILALLIIRDAFAIFYGLQVGYYLLINSAIVLLLAVIVTVIKQFNNK
ncbi:3-isopropylmalate dehydrogenase [Priestia sp. LL-8]|nr:3-isopropylmalate dehydrogenase [Priestia sp. LL-8]